MKIRTVSRARKRAYRARHKKPMGWWAKFAVIVSASAAATFVFAVWLGLHLGDIAEETGSDVQQTTQAAWTFSPMRAPVIIARGELYPRTLSDTGDSLPSDDANGGAAGTEEERTTNAPYNAVSAVLRYIADDGKTKNVYVSEKIEALGEDGIGEVPLGEGLAHIAPNGEYISAIFYVGFLHSDADNRELTRVYELSLASEIARSVGDIVICGIGTEEFDEAIEFARDLCEMAPGAKVGIALSSDFFSDEGYRAKLRERDVENSFFALDLTELETSGDLTYDEAVTAKINGLSAAIGAYNLRVLLSDADDGSVDKTVCDAINAGVYNLQCVRAPR